MSKEDHMFLAEMKRSVKILDGHYVLPLPFRKQISERNETKLDSNELHPSSTKGGENMKSSEVRVRKNEVFRRREIVPRELKFYTQIIHQSQTYPRMLII